MTINKIKIIESGLPKTTQMASRKTENWLLNDLTSTWSPRFQTSNLQKTLRLGTLIGSSFNNFQSLFPQEKVWTLSVTLGAQCDPSSLTSLCVPTMSDTEPPFLQIFQLNWIVIGLSKFLKLYASLFQNREMKKKKEAVICQAFTISDIVIGTFKLTSNLLNLKVDHGYLKISLKPNIAGPHPQSFWLCRHRVESDNLHF